MTCKDFYHYEKCKFYNKNLPDEYNPIELCLYVAFNKGTFQQAVDIEIGGLSTKRPNFAE